MEDHVLKEIGIWLRTSSVVELFDQLIGQREENWKAHGLRLADDWAKVNCHPI